MSRIPIDNREIRTYPDTLPPDVEQEPEPPEVESDEEVHMPMKDRLQQNIRYIDQHMNAEPPWKLMPQIRNTSEGVPVQLVVKPTASRIYHNFLTPYIYRSIGGIRGMDHLANWLSAPSDWRRHYDRVVSDRTLSEKFSVFTALSDDKSEARIQAAFSGIVTLAGYILDGTDIEFSAETKVVVGGILAKHEYDLRSSTDYHFFKSNGVHMLATEAKTKRTFPPGHVWYNKSRGVQVLTAMYAQGCPTFLYNQNQWKLFIENDSRKGVLTFPFDYQAGSAHTGSTKVCQMGPTIIQAICICLLSKRDLRAHTPERLPPVTETPQAPTGILIQQTSPENPPVPVVRRSARLTKKSGMLMPSFLSGHENGVPVYSDIRVYSPEQVAAIEEQIKNLEKQMRPSATSESINTLVQT